MIESIGKGTAILKFRLAKESRPWLLDCRVHAADGLILSIAIPYPCFCSRSIILMVTKIRTMIISIIMGVASDQCTDGN